MSKTKTLSKSVNVSAKSIEEAFDQAKLTWIVEQSQMMNLANGKTVEGKKVLYRGDNNNQLGVVGSDYGIIQNSDCFAFFNTICKDYNANICKVTEYRGGSLVHIEAEVRDRSITVRKGDECGFRFNLWNSFDGLRKASVTYGIIRLVCTNGMVAFDKDHSNSIEIKHSMHAVSRMEQALKVWAGGDAWFNYFKECVQKLNQKMVDKKMVDKFLEDVFGDGESCRTVEKKETTIKLFESGKGNGKGTAWDLINGVTEYIDHFSRKDPAERFEYANAGAGYGIKAKAFNLALSL